MKFQLHNKIEVVINEKIFSFFNNMLTSVFVPLKSLSAYASRVALGTGSPSVSQDQFRLTNFVKVFNLELEQLQNNPSKGTPFIKKSFLINSSNFPHSHLTEIGLADASDNDNPTIFNYISLIDSTFPNGVEVNSSYDILIYVYIYLNLETESLALFTAGDNEFIKFLLGEGLNESVYATRGVNTSDNVMIEREQPLNQNLFETTFSYSVNSGENKSNELLLNFSADLFNEKTYEIVFMVGAKPFARINLLEYKSELVSTETFSPKDSFVIDLGEDVKSINSIINNETLTPETNVYFKKYANCLADKITLPFKNIFNADTSRFVSKDGTKIYFLINDYVYGFINQNYNILKLDCGNISLQQISKIISFEKFLFVINNESPYISCYILDSDNIYQKITIDLNNESLVNVIDKILHIDITLSNDNTLMIAIIDSLTNNGHTFYFEFNQDLNKFIFLTNISSDHNFSYILAMYKNNFCDARVMFLEEGEYSSDCRIVTHFADKTCEDIYTVLGYYYTKDTKEVYTKSRAVVVEKTSSPKLLLYYYPQMYEYKLPLISDEDDDFLSTNLLYLIQKRNNKFKIYNLIGYNEPQEFEIGFDESIDQNSIIDFEFLNDTLLIFTSNENEPILAYNLKDTNSLIENVSSISATYNVDLSRYDILGKNNEGVMCTFSIKISL